MKRFIYLIILSLTCVAFSLPAEADEYIKPRFKAGKKMFLLDGKPLVIKAAELHYPRIPRPYWEHRIQMCKALGMNTVCLYVFWNAHEQQPGQFNFEEQLDLAEFCRLCQKNDMYVILRPGPYVCAEWEMGGLPWWLLKNREIRLREDDPYFLERVDIFEEQVAAQVAELTIDNGGPIIMVQVENEYGSYGENKTYVAAIRDIVRKHFGEVTLFQCDWASNFTLNGLDDLIWTMNFGAGANIDQQFTLLKELRPNSPLMCSEYWSGWFDKWGANHETRDAETMIAGIDEMLSKDISFSLYMTHGGTNWGHWAGANSPGYAPDVTSYDYDAPINEAGHTTPKYWALRQTLSKYMPNGEKMIAVPEQIPTVRIPQFRFTEMAPLFENLPKAQYDEQIRTMEEYDQGFGSILYSTTLPEIKTSATLRINEVHDFAQIFIDGKYIGSLDRRHNEKQITLPACDENARLDILVEAMGRINFGRAIKDYKGITEDVELTVDLYGRPFTSKLTGWSVYNIHDDYAAYQAMKFRPIESITDQHGQRIPGCYRATFNVRKVGDTFLNFESWGKGLVYVNGHALGRIWEIGPQQTLYMPGCWLHKGENEILVFDIVGPRNAVCEGLREPMIDHLQSAKAQLHSHEGLHLDLSEERAVHSSRFKAGNGWQSVTFKRPTQGRYLCIEALSAHDGKELACIAEFYVIDQNGKRITREPWTIKYADSEDVTNVNRSADKMYDLQESTYWSSESGKEFPHRVVIDLGSVHHIGGIEYLPRMEEGAPGSIKDYKIYIKQTNFDF